MSSLANQQAELATIQAQCDIINGTEMNELSTHSGAGKGDADRTSNKNRFKQNFEEIKFTGVDGLKPVRPGRSRKSYGKH